MLLSKGLVSWRQTIYIVGLPRSGKSTIYNVLASCKAVEALEEPFDLLSVAQKASQYSPDSAIYNDLQDMYVAMMENHFSELVLGRAYNFRVNDKSYVLNYKTLDHVELAHSRARRADVLSYAKEADTAMLVVFNDLERSLEFVGRDVPHAQFVHIKRNLLAVACDIAAKGWLTDEQLSSLANLAPAYGLKVRSRGNLIYLPYLICEADAELFVSLDDFERAVMYSAIQNAALTKALSETAHPYLAINFEDVRRSPQKQLNELVEQLRLQKTQVTEDNINAIASLNLTQESLNKESVKISSGLKFFLRDFPEWEF